ncbi:hypothetical protein RHMOL_Rhmol07G0231500 [Rhododendron molle]|uniref:Uncharacterized protein n=1 Tax=Rhododendron molle TaxID=49168 RepID=A0ACC0N5G6_RHOML|nr:hypothetical protein RHMOL_Rhmol07G0231500 [Rhododendron molle]
MEFRDMLAINAMFSMLPTFDHQEFELYPNRRKGFDPLGFITAVLTMVGVFVPLIFREMHKSQGPALLICGTRGTTVGRPIAIELRYVAPIFSGAMMASLVWFLDQWKRNVLARALGIRSIPVVERENLLIFNRISTTYLYLNGVMLVAIIFIGVVPWWISIIAIGIPGVIGGLILFYHLNCPGICKSSAGNGELVASRLDLAPAIAGKDIVRNVISGVKLIMFELSVGKIIRVHDVNAQVVGVGLTTTCLLMNERIPLTVPNSLLLKLWIHDQHQFFITLRKRMMAKEVKSWLASGNETKSDDVSRVMGTEVREAVGVFGAFDRWDAMVAKVPLQTFDIDKIPETSNDIKQILISSPKVCLEEPPFCFLSQTQGAVDLVLGCSLRYMSENELISTKKEFIIQSIEIIKQHGATLACSLGDLLDSC